MKLKKPMTKRKIIMKKLKIFTINILNKSKPQKNNIKNIKDLNKLEHKNIKLNNKY